MNLLDRIRSWRSRKPHSEETYGAIVAQARLPVFYQDLGVPDTLEGRFVILSLHLFAVLHRLKGKGAEASELAQGLVDRFTADMETVLRELGVGDLSVPKKVRALAATGAAQIEGYERALSGGREALTNAIAAALPGEANATTAVSGPIAAYVEDLIKDLETIPLKDICAGRLRFPEAYRASV